MQRFAHLLCSLALHFCTKKTQRSPRKMGKNTFERIVGKKTEKTRVQHLSQSARSSASFDGTPFIPQKIVGLASGTSSLPGLLLLDGESAERPEATGPARVLLLVLGLRS